MDKKDEARQCRSSTYAKAKGFLFENKGEYSGNSAYILHSETISKHSFNSSSGKPLKWEKDTIMACKDGKVDSDTWASYGVRTAIRIDLSSYTYKYAGTVSTDDLSKGQEYKEKSTGAYYRVIKSDKNGVLVDYLKPQNKKLKSITIQNSTTIRGQRCIVSGIAPGAFKNSKNLKSINIGNDINKIDQNAFSGCKNLNNITIKSVKMTKNSFGKNAFKSINKKATIEVPKKVFKNYKKWIKKAGAPKTVKYKKQ